MGTNMEKLDNLFEGSKIDIKKSELFDKSPEPSYGTLDFDRIDGMMLALAIGDSLGATTEGRLPEARKEHFSPGATNGSPDGRIILEKSPPWAAIRAMSAPMDAWIW